MEGGREREREGEREGGIKGNDVRHRDTYLGHSSTGTCSRFQHNDRSHRD